MAISSSFHACAGVVVLVLVVISTAAAKYSGGSGTAGDPYRIATAIDLMLLGGTPEDYASHFLLVADIDLDPNLPRQKVFDRAVIAPAGGTSTRSLASGAAFGGVFDGGGHTISHLAIRGVDYLGLFGKLSSRAEIRNLAVVDVSIVGSGSQMGGLAGCNEGRIRACYVKGEVHGGRWVGGVVGYTYGMISACYAQVRVSGTTYVGGFTGNTGGTMVRCYATGQVVRAEDCDFVGGFAGQSNMHGSFTGCLWDIGTSGIVISTCGVGFDTARLTGHHAYALNGWAGDPNWVLDAGHDYARLVWEGSPGQAIGEPNINDWLAGGGTSEDPYQIATAEQLALAASASILWDKALALTADVDVNGIQVQRIGVSPGSEFRGSFDGRGHTIRNLTMDTGDLSASWVALFGWIHADGRVSNLNLEHAVVKGGGQRSAYLGALAGLNRGSISNCTAVDVLVEGRATPGGSLTYLGELVDYSNGSVDVRVEGPSAPGGSSAYLGGLVGYNDGRVDHCRTTGEISGGWEVGGLIGLNHGSVLHCRAEAAVSGKYIGLGGLVGVNAGVFEFVASAYPGLPPRYSIHRRAVVKNCFATGQVAGDEDSMDVGGLVGANTSGADVEGCCATGAVGGRWCVGGLVGCNAPGNTITNSYAKGDIVGRSEVGGLVGANDGMITTCYAAGKVVGDENVGGFTGLDSYGDVAESFWDIEVSGLSESAAGAGKTTAEMQIASTFLDAGWDFVGETANGSEDIWWIDEGEDYPRLSWERQ
ncbi:MAG: hypothetical protein JW955_01955 [Sedimentisphaerales bacterium]|nr:hypothetical protein [Sedimentisphaerales bacterium]